MRRDRLHDKIGDFVVIPVSVIKMWHEMGVDAVSLFVYLRYRTNGKTETAYPSYDTISKQTRLTRKRIAKAIHTLEKHKLLTRKRRFSGSTLYTLHYPSAISPTSELMRDSISPTSELPLVPRMHANKIEINKIERGSTPRAARKSKTPRKPKVAFTPTPLMQSLEKLTQQNIDWREEKNASILSQLEEAKANPEDVTRFGEWWRNDWRGAKGDVPSLREVWKDWRKGTQPRAEREWTETYE